MSSYGDHRDLHSFPTRRSSDLRETGGLGKHAQHSEPLNHPNRPSTGKAGLTVAQILDEDRGNGEQGCLDLQPRAFLALRATLTAPATVPSTSPSRTPKARLNGLLGRLGLRTGDA